MTTMASDNYTFDFDVEDFQEKVLQVSEDKPVLVDFWADWCGPCRFLDPVLKEVLAGYGGSVVLAKIEVDEGENMKLAGQYQVRGFPTVLLFRHGEEQARFSSARSTSYVTEFIENNADFS